MSENQEEKQTELFFPYYVNQGRLLDIYAILNGGYSEYAEITTAISDEKSKSGKVEVSSSVGFKLFNLGGNVSADSEKTDSQSKENKERKVQTVTSILSIVKSELTNKGYLHDIKQAKARSFVCLPVVLSINSIKSYLSEMSELLKLSENIQKIGTPVKRSDKSIKDFINSMKTIQQLFEGEEVLYETESFAIIGNIVDSNLYQAVRADIIGAELTCLAQVKRVFPNGTVLMKNTIFARMKDQESKQQMIDALNNLSDMNLYDFEAVTVFSIQNKPVYQLEIIALYQ